MHLAVDHRVATKGKPGEGLLESLVIPNVATGRCDPLKSRSLYRLQPVLKAVVGRSFFPRSRFGFPKT